MEYLEFSPAGAMASLVRCYWSLSNGDNDSSAMHGSADAASADPALPDGSPELIFNLGDPFDYVAPDGVVTRQPQAFLVGQITRPMVVRPTGRIDLVAVRLESHGASILYDHLNRLTDRWIDVGEMPNDHLQLLAANLGSATSIVEKLSQVRDCLECIVAEGPAPDPRVAAAVRAIRESYGTVALDTVAHDLALAPRTLQRLFAAQVGISPKLLARIVRFQRVFTAWRTDARSLARVAAECGYFDQSHLVRDFRDFAGAPPAGFLAALPEFTGFFVA